MVSALVSRLSSEQKVGVIKQKQEIHLCSQACKRQGSYSFELFKFHDFPWLFPWPFQVFQYLRFSCQLHKFKTFTCFGAFFNPNQFNRHKLWRSPKCVPFTLLNYSSLSYIVLALLSAVNYLSNRTLILALTSCRRHSWRTTIEDKRTKERAKQWRQ